MEHWGAIQPLQESHVIDAVCLPTEYHGYSIRLLFFDVPQQSAEQVHVHHYKTYILYQKIQITV